MFRSALALAALACAGDAVAQTSNCMAMGGGMVHCDNMGTNGSTSSTNCTSMGGGTATCNTMEMGQPQRSSPTPDMSRPQTNGTALNFVGDLVARSQERSFQKKVGQMLAAGDCIGTSTFAHAHGHEAQSDQILRSCQFNQPAPSTAGTASQRGTARNYIRAVAQRVDVISKTDVRIRGTRSELLRTLTAASGVEAAVLGVRGIGPKWCRLQDSNL